MTRFGTALTTGVLALALVLGASPAHAADEIGVAWDPSQPAADALTRPVFEGVRAVPGDTGTRSFIAVNRGTMTGTLTASIVDVVVTGDPDDQWYLDFTINAIPVRDLLDGATPILTEQLAPEDFADIDLTYDFPESSSSGNYGVDEPPVTVSFYVELKMSGDIPATAPPAGPTATPTVPPTATPTVTPAPSVEPTDDPAAVIVDDAPKPPLAITGSTAAATIVGAGILLLALGAGLRATMKRRERIIEAE